MCSATSAVYGRGTNWIASMSSYCAVVKGLSSHSALDMLKSISCQQKHHKSAISISVIKAHGATQWYYNKTLSDGPRTKATRYRIKKILSSHQPPYLQLHRGDAISMLTSWTRFLRNRRNFCRSFHVQTLPRTLHTAIVNFHTVYRALGNA